MPGLFDYADERAAHARERSRKGWLTALRDTAALKTAYAFGLRRRELVMPGLADFGANPHAPESGGYGVVYVRWGKASKGQPAEAAQRADGVPVVSAGLGQWVEQFRGLFDHATPGGGALWPSERSSRVSLEKIRLTARSTGTLTRSSACIRPSPPGRKSTSSSTWT
jgi:integrase/recombinase XerC